MPPGRTDHYQQHLAVGRRRGVTAGETACIAIIIHSLSGDRHAEQQIPIIG
ncbi:hypothetical protein [Xenorhabdus beddingii]|uniref:hypothetical protein n=1 Tax=Xenorhabdus beddingii TaxID=40578 RepID=UPI001428D50E|nr:hypothetical protein [Xenorhabdus beddingii]